MIPSDHAFDAVEPLSKVKPTIRKQFAACSVLYALGESNPVLDILQAIKDRVGGLSLT